MYLNGYNREKVMEVIRQQNHGRRAGDEYACMYKNDDGNKCIVGCFIPEDKYDSRMENKSANDIVLGCKIDGEFKPDPFGIELDMPMQTKYLTKLQIWHDDQEYLEGEDFYKAIESQLIDFEKQWSM